MTPITGTRNIAKITRTLRTWRGYLRGPPGQNIRKRDSVCLLPCSSASKLKATHIVLSLTLHETGQDHRAWK